MNTKLEVKATINKNMKKLVVISFLLAMIISNIIGIIGGSPLPFLSIVGLTSILYIVFCAAIGGAIGFKNGLRRK